jgi:hypothetical protein
MTYHPGLPPILAAEQGRPEPLRGPHVACDTCGKSALGTTRKGDSKSWLRAGSAPPGWLLVRVETEAGVVRRDYCGRCRP